MFFEGRRLKEGSEGFLNVLHRVLEIEHEGAVLAGIGPVQTRKGLHRLKTRQLLVDIHCDQFRLIEAGLIFLGDHEDPIGIRVELLRQLGFGEAVRSRFGPLIPIDRQITGERDERLEIGIALVCDIVVEALPITQRVLAALGDDHRLRLAL